MEGAGSAGYAPAARGSLRLPLPCKPENPRLLAALALACAKPAPPPAPAAAPASAEAAEPAGALDPASAAAAAAVQPAGDLVLALTITNPWLMVVGSDSPAVAI